MAATVKEEADDPNLNTFKDEVPPIDPIYEYTDDLKAGNTPIVIDNGSYKCRVGWASDEEPRLIFKNVIAKQRGKREETTQTAVGNDITNLEVMRWQLKSQFDRDVVTQFDVQESVFDYTFSHLGIDTEGRVDHPIVLTETVCNPNHSRQQMSELLFECYCVPSVLYGIDSQFSLYKNHPSPNTCSALVIGCGYNTVHIAPVLDGRLCNGHCRRINLGGCQVDAYMQRLLQLKHSAHLAAVSVSRAEELVARHGRIAVDYQEDIRRWGCDDYYGNNVAKYQLPFNPLVASTAQNPEQQKLRREEQARRLKEMAARKREEKLANETQTLKKLLNLQQLLEDHDEDEMEYALKEMDLDSYEELQSEIQRISENIQRIRNRIKEVMEEESREKTQGPSEAKKPKVEYKLVGEPPVTNPRLLREWIEMVRQKRQDLLNKKAARKQRRLDMTKRRTHASHQRMKIITELAQGMKRKKEDTFGMKDEDWNVYKAINKDAGDSDSEAEQEHVDHLENMLRDYDPDFKDPLIQCPIQPLDIKEHYQIHVAVEQIRCPEVLFQLSMVGMDQSGIAETIDFVLKKFTPEEQNRLVKYVFITGGCASFPGFKERLEKDLLAMRPFESEFAVFRAQNPVMDAWYGARDYAQDRALLEKYAITRKDYEEKGGEYLKEHFVTNTFYPTPSVPAKEDKS